MTIRYYLILVLMILTNGLKSQSIAIGPVVDANITPVFGKGAKAETQRASRYNTSFNQKIIVGMDAGVSLTYIPKKNKWFRAGIDLLYSHNANQVNWIGIDTYYNNNLTSSKYLKQATIYMNAILLSQYAIFEYKHFQLRLGVTTRFEVKNINYVNFNWENTSFLKRRFVDSKDERSTSGVKYCFSMGLSYAVFLDKKLFFTPFVQFDCGLSSYAYTIEFVPVGGIKDLGICYLRMGASFSFNFKMAKK